MGRNTNWLQLLFSNDSNIHACSLQFNCNGTFLFFMNIFKYMQSFSTWMGLKKAPCLSYTSIMKILFAKHNLFLLITKWATECMLNVQGDEWVEGRGVWETLRVDEAHQLNQVCGFRRAAAAGGGGGWGGNQATGLCAQYWRWWPWWPWYSRLHCAFWPVCAPVSIVKIENCVLSIHLQCSAVPWEVEFVRRSVTCRME